MVVVTIQLSVAEIGILQVKPMIGMIPLCLSTLHDCTHSSLTQLQGQGQSEREPQAWHDS